MNKITVLLLALGVSASGLPAAAPKLTDDQLDFFEKKIRPVLADHCYKCHSAGAEKIRGGLLVDTREGLLKGGESGPAIVPGNPDRSLLIKTVRYTDPDIGMPPKGQKLPDEVIADLEQWVRMGAPDPREGKAPALTVDMDQARKHWAFQPVVAPAVPKVADPKGFVKNPIDAFVLAKLKEKGLAPSAPADKRTLLRRVTYDLTGLPPTPEEMDAFLADNSPNAFEKVVDRLLASPRYGERWGRHWLDVARYADTSGDRQAGNRRNPLYPYAWTYRDYVIQAFNNDLPYDQFIVQQIAGDKLPEAAQNKQIYSALGFLTVGKRFMGNENEVIDDRIDVVTKGLMALTVSCARCHDHKFDPVPIKDYYSLHGVFASSIEPSEGPLLVQPEANPAYDEYLKEAAKIEAEVEEFHERESARFVAGMLWKAGDYLMAMHDAQKDRERGSYRLLARQRGLDSELAEIWLEMLKPLARKNDPVFGPWFRFAALPDKEFAARAPALAAEIAKGHQSEVHPLLAKAFTGKSPKSLKEVAGIYTAVLGALHKELKLPEYVPFRTARGRGFDKAKTETVLADINMESLRQYFFGKDSPVAPDARQMQRTLGVQFSNLEGQIRAKLVTLNMTHPGSPARAMALQDAPRPRDSRVMIRGEPRNLGPVAPRQFLEVLAGDKRQPFKEGSGRLELARAIASRDNPLTARVFVNRVWYWHFGQPIVRTMSDFGLRSDPPTHPELLDHLAAWFMDNGWSVKKLHKYILLSSTYQQDSRSNKKGMEVDPTNQWLWRFNIQRLDFESIRDTLLQVSGKLDLTMGGPSIPLKLGDGSSTPRRGDYTNLDDSRANPYRRTVYAMIDRAQLPSAFNIFDFANPDMSSGERILTTVPQQALFMMNGPFVVEQVKSVLARPDVQAKTNPEDKVRHLYRILYQRAPTPAELELAKDYLAQALAEEQPQTPADLNNRLTPEAMKNMSREERQKAYQRMVASRSSSSAPRAQPLNAWERFTQVLLISNEMIFVN
jgi:cytochrome c553